MFVFAHYWGIDEVGVFVIPALLAIVALRWAERKAKRAAALKEAEEKEATQVSGEKTDVD